MNEINEMIAELDAEDMDQARRMTGSQRFRAGADLFEEACRWTLAGIRSQFPGISEEDALTELRRRLEDKPSSESPD